MGGTTIVAGGGCQNMMSTYYTHVIKIYFTRLVNEVFHLLTDYSVALMYGLSSVSIAKLCYVISFAACEGFNVIITIMKTVQCSVSCSPGMQKMGDRQNFSLALQYRGAAPRSTGCNKVEMKYNE